MNILISVSFAGYNQEITGAKHVKFGRRE